MNDTVTAPASTKDTNLKDPVCGMTVTEQSEHKELRDSKMYYFCSSKCHTKFNAEPGKYILSKTTPVKAEETPSTAIYTCPMHPEIRQDHPGSCPKCGMTLEPVIPELEDDDNPELKDFQHRFWWTLPLTVIVFVLAMSGESLHLMQMSVQSWVEMAIASPIVLWAGWPFFTRGWQSLLHRSPNMWTLISLGTGAAFIYSVVATLIPQVFPDSFISMGRVAVYF
ncbi:MAG: heavy metal-binding domain-containing protein, partial [Undibacterium umbellatum]|uniref:heavy metal-binding domain-containing protein n=1 Tax=Undibacterium umbellatum TaxID=2762300 RepID=UPI003BB6B0B7